MIQVFDPHRTMYRNAKLRAFSDEDKTTRIKFFDMTNVEDEAQYDDIGLEVSTDQNGYIMRSGGQQKVNCLAVEEDAIIEVSLDGGTSWPIQWILHAGDTGTNAKVKKLYFFNGQGNEQSGNLSDTAIHLPDYLLRSESNNNNTWAEEEVVVSGGSTDSWETIPITNWTHVITFDDIAVDQAKFVFGLPLRTAQTILVYNRSAYRVKLSVDDLAATALLAPWTMGVLFKADETHTIFKIIGESSGGGGGDGVLDDPYILINAATASGMSVDLTRTGNIVYVSGTWDAGAAKAINLIADPLRITKCSVINNTSENMTVRWMNAGGNSKTATVNSQKVAELYRPNVGDFIVTIADIQ